MAFPGLDTLQPFLSDITVGPDTDAKNWLLCLKSDVQTVEELLAERRYDVYPAKRYAQAMVFVVLEWDCTLTRLETVFGAPLLGKVIEEHSVQKLKDFLLGVKGTNMKEWGTVFSRENAKFSQFLLTQFAVELKIDFRDTLVALYYHLHRLFDIELCRRLNVSITAQDADRLFKDHFRNSWAFKNDSQLLRFANTAVNVVENTFVYSNHMSKSRGL